MIRRGAAREMRAIFDSMCGVLRGYLADGDFIDALAGAPTAAEPR
ncbi:hypothetical protein I545_3490 [Mycobacterium kansasii 662]|nr:hypothetical protein I545_3490 [Mycobacterium kansasii 662]KEP39273.1 hypothetical protein MKSMC1_55690 [Mycobacterium kansasii]